MNAARIKISDAWRFFLPLIFMTELNMISKSVIHAFLARTPDPSVTLAAFNTSFTFYYTVTGCTEITTLLAIAWLSGRRNLARISGFLSLLLAAPIALVLAVAFTPWAHGFTVTYSGWEPKPWHRRNRRPTCLPSVCRS